MSAAPREHVQGKEVDQVESRRRPNYLGLLAALNIPLSIWLIASTYLLHHTLWYGARVNNNVMGALILGMAITRLAMFSPRYWWLSLGNLIFGVWLIIAPFVLGFTPDATATINSIVVGILVAVFSAAGLVDLRERNTNRATA
jgi:hypothetical protein